MNHRRTHRVFGSILLALSAATACGEDDSPEAPPESAGKGGSAGRSGSGGAGKGGRAGSGGSGGATAEGGSAGSSGTTAGQSGEAGEDGGTNTAGAGGNGGDSGSPDHSPGGNGGEASLDGTAGASGAPASARLVVADPEAAHLYVLSVPQGEIVSDFAGITFAEHPGFLPLDDGRVLFTDAASEQLVVLDALADQPRIVRRIALGAPPVHLAVDPGQDWAAVSGAGALAGEPGPFTLVNLADYSSKIARIPTGEPGVLLGGDPLHVYHRNDTPPAFESYRLQDLLAGTVSLAGSQPLGEFPHGEAIVHTLGKLFTAADDGINVVSVNGGTFGDTRVIPYTASSRAGGRAFYARLSADGNFLYSYLRDSGPNFDWPWRDWTNDAYIVDVGREEAKRLEVGNGLVYRLADSLGHALFVQYHPDGDFAHLLDTDPDSPTFQTFVAEIPLEAMTSTPTGPDADPWSSVAFRIAGMVPSGAWGFVTHGGDSKITVIDIAGRKLERTITLPTPLDYGGYLVGVEAGSRYRDTVGR